jgi:uncharacterized membrane protein
MKTNQELKNAALAALKGNWKPAVLLALIVTVITAIPSLLGQGDGTASVAGIVSMLIAICVAMPLSVGAYASFRKLYLGQEVKLVEDSFKTGFQNWKHNVGGMLLMIVYTFLWTLLLIVPGIIKSFSYALVPYILTDKPELTAEEAINLSMKMMDGHKLDLFILSLSFIGWSILAIFTLCIGYLWLTPYIYTTMIAFYEDVKAEYESKAVVA